MAAKRAGERDITIPPCENPRRRRRCSKGPALWLSTYMPKTFSHPFTNDQLEMVDAVMSRIRFGGRRAHAAARGDGKTSIVKGCTVYAICEGLIRFPLIIAINQSAADRIQSSIKRTFERNDMIHADYPEICTPIRALRGAPSRSGGMTVGGVSVRMQWSGEFLVFPTVDGSKASGAILAARGIESPFRGFNCDDIRPDLVIIDDPEDRASARSDVEILRGIETIDRDVTGLAGQDKSIAIIYLCTIITHGCMAALYTDRKRSPAWGGVRKKFLIEPPADLDAWDVYFRMRIEDQIADDSTAARAHKHYLENRRVLDAGSEVSNPHRFDKTPRPGGGTIEASALQSAMNIICDTDWTSFNAEYQNIPPSDDIAETDQLDGRTVIQRLSGRVRGVVPHNADYLEAGIDVHGRHLEWTLTSFRGAVGEVVDYGSCPVHSPMSGGIDAPENIEQVNDAIVSALCEWRDANAGGWPIDSPEDSDDPPDVNVRRGHDSVMIDARWRPDAVFAFVRIQLAAGDKRFKAAMGLGSRAGQGVYTPPTKRGGGKKFYGSGHLYATRQPARRAWLFNLNDDFFKAYVQDAFRVPVGRPGSLVLFGDDPVSHRQYAREIIAEKRRRRFVPGKGFIDDWVVLHRDNHKLDSTKLTVAGAVVDGMKLVSDPGPRPDAEKTATGKTVEGPKIITKTRPKARHRQIGRRDFGR